MKFSLKPHQLLAHWMPGFIVLAVVFLDDLYNGSGRFDRLVKAIAYTPNGSNPSMPDLLDKAVIMLAFVAVAFALGQFFDAARNLLEWVADMPEKFKIKWEKIMEMERERLEIWDDYYFSYYVFDANLAFGLAMLLTLQYFSILHLVSFCWIALIVVMGVLALDAFGLRCEIKEILDRGQQPLSHPRRRSASSATQGGHQTAAETEEVED